MYWSLVAILLAGTPVPDKLSPYRGQPVVWVAIDAPAYENLLEIERLIEIQPGYLLSTNDLHKAIKRLYSLGRFSNVQVYAKRLGGSVELTFELKPKLYIGEIEITGTDSIIEAGLLSALTLRRNEEIDSRTESTLKQRALNYLDRMGYPNATLELRREQLEDERLVGFSLGIDLGKPNLVHSIKFSGTPKLSERYLSSQISSQIDMPLNMEFLETDQRTLEQLYLTHDFREVVVTEPLIEQTPLGAVVTFSVNAGHRISIEFSGNHQIQDTNLLSSWPDSRGRLTRGDLTLFQRRVLRAYRRIGYFNAQVGVRGFVDREQEVTRYLFTIQEGPPLTVSAVSFPGAHAFSQKQLEGHISTVLLRSLGTDGVAQPLQTHDRETISYGGDNAGHDSGAIESQIRRKSITQGKRWIPELYSEAVNEIRAAYQNLGYLQAKVGPAQIELQQDQGTVYIPVSEGSQTRVASISFRNNLELTSLELLELVGETTELAPGSPLSASGVEDARIGLIRAYRDRGYIYCRVFSDIIRDEKSAEVQISFRFEEGLQVHISEVLVRGNRHTRDSFIRNRISFEEGDVYRLDQAIEDQRKISSLGVFSSVRLKLIDEDTPAERKDLIADVIERKRHRIQMGGGLSTEDGPRLKLIYSHLNLYGVGANFVSSLKLNRQVFFGLYGEDKAEAIREAYDAFEGIEELTKGLEHEIRLSLGSPVFNQLLFDPVLRADLISERDNLVSYFLQTVTAAFGVTLTPAPWLKMAFEPQLSVVQLDCISQACSTEIDEYNQATGGVLSAGYRQGFKVGPVFTLDFRDNPLNPTRGVSLHFDVHFATGKSRSSDDSPLKQYKFSKMETGINGYIPLGPAVLALAGWGGNITPLNAETDTPLDERFLLGGRSTLRGHVQNSVTPQGCPEETCTGGLAYALLKSELRIPVPFGDNLFVDLFFETGNLWYDTVEWDRSRFRIGTGIGLSYRTPVGPLSVSIGWNPTNEGEEPETQWHFTVGQF